MTDKKTEFFCPQCAEEKPLVNVMANMAEPANDFVREATEKYVKEYEPNVNLDEMFEESPPVVAQYQIDGTIYCRRHAVLVMKMKT